MSVSIQLHPLVVLNVSDHLTRAKHLSNKKEWADLRVIGALLGKQEGRVLEIVNTIELSFTPSQEGNDAITMNEQFCAKRLDAYKKIFPDLDCLGWYSADFRNNDKPTVNDANVHKRMKHFSENPLYLKLNPESLEAKERSHIPFYLYELDAQLQFVRLDYELATADSERIAVDQVSKALDPNKKTSELSHNLQSTLNAVKFLRIKINFLISMVKSSEEVRKNHQFMRKLN